MSVDQAAACRAWQLLMRFFFAQREHLPVARTSGEPLGLSLQPPGEEQGPGDAGAESRREPEEAAHASGFGTTPQLTPEGAPMTYRIFYQPGSLNPAGVGAS